MRRTFHQRFTLAAKCAISIFLLLAFYLLWMKMAIAGAIVVVVILLIIERVAHTTYVFSADERGEWLTISRGRFVRPRTIAVNEIIRCTSMKTSFGFSHYLLLEYGADHLATVQPESDEDFVQELRKRQRRADESAGQEKRMTAEEIQKTN